MKRLFSLASVLLMSAVCCLSGAAQSSSQERLIILNEGNWGANNARISYFENGRVVTDKLFMEKNGYGIGDTPNDIIQVGDDLIAIAVNSSNIIQFMRTDGTAVAAVENVPNNRRLATDGSYLYVTSYAHECSTKDGLWTCTKGYVAKISLTDFKVESCCEVGFEPEGIAYYKGCLFVANTGGYSVYESTVSIVDAENMTLIRNVDTGAKNLYGTMSQSGRYLCINSSGDYYSLPACTVIFDCEKALSSDECFIILDGPSTYNCTAADGRFLSLGTDFNYVTYETVFYLRTIDPVQLFASSGVNGVEDGMPGTVAEDIASKMASPYGIYVNPYSGYIYATDAVDYVSPGMLHQWTPEGKYVGCWPLYVSPGHFLALGDWTPAGMSVVRSDASDDRIYDLNGIEVNGTHSGLTIVGGRIQLR